MPNPDVQQAAERLRRVAAQEDPVVVYGTMTKPQCHAGRWYRADMEEAAQACIANDKDTLADAYLALIREDDTPIDDEFIAASGMYFAWNRWRIGTVDLEIVAWKYNDDWHVGLCGPSGDTIVFPHIKTRGDLRRLAAALKIPLREGAEDA